MSINNKQRNDEVLINQAAGQLAEAFLLQVEMKFKNSKNKNKDEEKKTKQK